MPAISPITRAKIKGYLEAFIDRVVDQHKTRQIPVFENPRLYLGNTASKPKLKPFHAAIIPNSLMRFNEFERSFSTTLGTTFEECARLIALEHHAEVQRGYDIMGNVSREADQEIDRQVALFERNIEFNGKTRSLERMIQTVLDARENGEVSQKITRSDLYIRTRDGIEFFFEIKSPVPNKDQCLTIIYRILRNHLIRGLPRPQVQSYFAMAYNPYGPERKDYRWSVARM